MKKKIIILGIILGALILTFLLSGCVKEEESKITFSDDIDIELQENIEEAIFGATGDVTYGTTYPFNEVDTDDISVVALDSTHIVVAYQDTGGDTYGCARIGVISGTPADDIAFGTENCFNSALTEWVSVAKIDSTHFVVAYRDGGTWEGTAIIGVTDGDDTISSYGGEKVFNSGTTNSIQVDMLDLTHIVVAYQDAGNSNYGTAVVGITDGSSTISSFGTENTFIDEFAGDIGMSVIDSTHFVVAYRATSSYGYAIIGETDGSTAISSYGSQLVFNSADSNYNDVVVLDSTHFAVVYMDDGGSDYGIARVGVTDGDTTINSYGDENIFNSVRSTNVRVSSYNSSHFVVVYEDDGGDDYGGSKVGTVSGTTISGYTDEVIFNSAITTDIDIDIIDSTHFIVSYKDDGGADYGESVIGTIEGEPEPSDTGAFFQFFN